jgi:predicted lipoprotein with Yx(FWY)xxD motif
MKTSFRVVAGLALLLALLLGLSALTVSAQGPTGTPTPAQAPAAAAAGTNLDDPGRAATLGNAVAAIPANTAEWFRFDYVTPVNTFPVQQVMARMVNGVTNGLGFEIWSPERMQGNWWENKPVGRGTQEVLPACTVTNPDGTTSRCTTNDLTWVGGFGVSGTYYLRVVNNTNSALAPQIIVSGAGLAQCQTPPSGTAAQPPAQAGNQGFTEVECPTASGTLVPVAGAAPGAAATPAATEMPAGAATPAGAPTLAATEAPTAAATSAATDTPAAAATSAATETPAGATTPAGAPSVTPAAGASAANMVTGLAVAQDAKLGPIVTDSQGRTLYAWLKDTGTTSNCTGSCAQTWPPASASGTPQAGSGITASMIGTSARSDGGTQVTFNGHPLYYFSGDKNPGDTNGQGIAGLWFTVSPDGTLNQMGGAGGSTTPGAAGTSAPGGTATP